MNIVLITTGKRPEILNQTIDSIKGNAADIGKHHLTAVIDLQSESGSSVKADMDNATFPQTTIMICKQGASRARNIGAASIPTYLRHENLCFFDDDVYACKDWDIKLEDAIRAGGNFFADATIVSGHAHPYNKGYGKYELGPSIVEAAAVLSTVNIAMPWKVWDDVGPFVEPGGPGGSEDVDWCRRAAKKGYGFAVTDPHCIIHTGLTSSSGKQIVGYEEMVKQNEQLRSLYWIENLRVE